MKRKLLSLLFVTLLVTAFALPAFAATTTFQTYGVTYTKTESATNTSVISRTKYGAPVSSIEIIKARATLNFYDPSGTQHSFSDTATENYKAEAATQLQATGGRFISSSTYHYIVRNAQSWSATQ